MLDNEPNSNDVTDSTNVDTGATVTPEPASRPRRRAVSRKAGPPAPVTEVQQPSAPTTSAPMQNPDAVEVTEPAVKERPARRRVTRGAAAPKPLPEPEQPVLADAAEGFAVEADPVAAVKDQAAAGAEKAVVGEDSEPAVESSASDEAEVAESDEPESGQDEDDTDADDPLASSLSALDESMAKRKVVESVADPFQAPPDPAEILGLRDSEESSGDEPKAEKPAAGQGDDGKSSDSKDTEDASDDSDGGSDSGDDSDSSGGGRRRRRRRGGRRRRRGGGSDDSDASGGSDDSDAKNDSSKESDSSDDGSGAESSDDEGSSGNRRRRRRRRRRGGGGTDSDSSDEVTGIEGSTRMEAKRQRRREGRASRRRAPVLSEAEFLARRESVDRKMIIRQNEELAQIAVLEDDVLVEHYVDRASASSLIGNVYLGRVQNVLPSMEAAFIDIGRGRNAVMYAGDIDWDAHGVDSNNRKVENALKSGQTVLVQVTKDPVGAKGARLTNHISLPGRYIVYAPGGHLSGISRKLPDTERKRLRDVLGDLVGDDASVIVRTAAEGVAEEDLVRDVNRLKAQWEAIEKQAAKGNAPAQLYAEPDATVRIVRDLFTEDFSKLMIEGNGASNDAYDTVTAYVEHVAPNLLERIERWDGDGDVFAGHRIDEQIAKALERKVFLPSGGSLIIERTEAMTVIDVNTGKFTGSGGNLEATVTSNNLEAAEEVVRQLRLRDIGGIIVIDFIDMVLPANRELLLRRLVECLGRDRTRHQVAEVTSLGLVQMTRKKIGTGLAEAFTEDCEHCAGRGYVMHDMPVDSQEAADGGERRRRRGGGGGRRRGGNSGGGNSGGGNKGGNGSKGD